MQQHFQGINLGYLGNPTPGQSLLDYGCGPGEISIFFIKNGLSVTGADVDPSCERKILDALNDDEQKRFHFHRLDPSSLPAVHTLLGAGRKFDYIVCREVLEHVSDPGAVLSLFSQLLGEGGRLVLSVPTRWSERYFSFWDPGWLHKSEHVRIFRRRDLRDMLSRNRLLCIREEGQSFRWTILWLVLAPFRIRHTMGNPASHHTLVGAALKMTDIMCSFHGLEAAGNLLFPKSRFYYALRRKPRVLVVYDYCDWILGKWAEHIRLLYGKEFDIVTMSMFHAMQEQRYAARLVNSVDVVHLLLPHPYDFFRKISSGKSLITTIHHWIEWDGICQRAASGSDRLVTGAQVWKERLVEKGLLPEHVTVVHSGVAQDFFRQHNSLLPKSSKLTCGFFAKMDSNESDRKGARHLIKLVQNMSAAGVGNRFRFIISGTGWDEQVADLNISGVETLYLQYVAEHEMPLLYRSLDVYLMLSDVEGGPVTIAEAMASGCVVFSTAVGVATEFIIDNVTGRIIDTADLEDLLSKLLHYQNHPEEVRAISERAQCFADEHLRFEHTFSPLGRLYHEAVSLIERAGEGELDTERERRITEARAARVQKQL